MWLVAVAEGAFSDTLSASLFAFPLYIAISRRAQSGCRSTTTARGFCLSDRAALVCRSCAYNFKHRSRGPFSLGYNN
ncbi:hypothetical protein SDJN02_04162, partial [Cucurbita argyrosperma subsp. argyrosperma]